MWSFGCGLFLGIILGFLIGVRAMKDAVKGAKPCQKTQ